MEVTTTFLIKKLSMRQLSFLKWRSRLLGTSRKRQRKPSISMDQVWKVWRKRKIDRSRISRVDLLHDSTRITRRGNRASLISTLTSPASLVHITTPPKAAASMTSGMFSLDSPLLRKGRQRDIARCTLDSGSQNSAVPRMWQPRSRRKVAEMRRICSPLSNCFSSAATSSKTGRTQARKRFQSFNSSSF